YHRDSPDCKAPDLEGPPFQSPSPALGEQAPDGGKAEAASACPLAELQPRALRDRCYGPAVPDLRFYTFPPSHNAVRTEIALIEKQLDFERIEIDLFSGEHHKPPLTELTPRQQVPTLVLPQPDGTELVVYESLAIIRLLDDLYPDPPLMPPVSEPARRAAALMRMEEFQAKLDPKNIFGSVVFRGKTRDELGERVDALAEELPRWDGYVGDQTYLAGDQFTLADIAVFPLLMHFEVLGYDYARHTPALAGYITRCKARDSVAKTGWLRRFKSLVETREFDKVLAKL
ncbi:MAG: glutathione S-transferase family protein, partial [Deltaproteobacteria bacterium]|nr:glutathione S-transferase family protein [Deltaproteobacteria bacterium]